MVVDKDLKLYTAIQGINAYRPFLILQNYKTKSNGCPWLTLVP